MNIYLKNKNLNKLSIGLIVISFVVGSAGCSIIHKDKNSDWIDLFNGKDLSNWQVKFAGHSLGDNYLDTFKVEDSKLTVSYDNYEEFDNKFGHLFYEQPFSHYKLQATYRFVGDQVKGGPGWATRNNGFMIHSQSAASMKLKQDFPTSIEVQLLGGLGKGDRPTSNICTPDTHVVIEGKLITDHCIKSSSKTYHGDQWVNIEIEVHGSQQIIHRVNGEEVFDYTNPQYDEAKAKSFINANNGNKMLSKGYIAIQAETAPIEFKSIRLLPLKSH